MTTDSQLPEALRLVAAEPLDAGRARRLHDRLAERAGVVDLLDVAYCTVDSPIGPLLLAATPQGLVRIAFALEDHGTVLGRLAEDIGPRILDVRHDPTLQRAAGQLGQYFAGRRTTFDVPVDLRLAHGFRRTVLEHLRDIAYGHTASYATVAAAAGNPNAVRAVGTACARNPLPVVVPCHRVVRSDGSIGQYLGGTDAKAALLELERRAA